METRESACSWESEEEEKKKKKQNKETNMCVCTREWGWWQERKGTNKWIFEKHRIFYPNNSIIVGK